MTSKTCHRCHGKWDTYDDEQRTWCCNACGDKPGAGIDRDEAASVNIAVIALFVLVGEKRPDALDRDKRRDK